MEDIGSDINAQINKISEKIEEFTMKTDKLEEQMVVKKSPKIKEIKKKVENLLGAPPKNSRTLKLIPLKNSDDFS